MLACTETCRGIWDADLDRLRCLEKVREERRGTHYGHLVVYSYQLCILDPVSELPHD